MKIPGASWFARLPRPIQLLLVTVAGTAAVAAFLVVPPWIRVYIPTDSKTERIALFLRGLLAAYLGTLALAIVGTLGALAVLVPSGPRGRRFRAARLLLLCVSTLFSFGLCEGAAWAWQSWKHRLPDLAAEDIPPEPEPPPDPLGKVDHDAGSAAPDPAARPLKILVIGESSARGEPYQDWLSIGHILGWQLESVFPGRAVEVDMQAAPGVALEIMHQKLATITYRPDVLVLYAGNNEFQGRFSWIRNVVHYDFERAEAPRLSPVNLMLRLSPVCRLILETIDKQAIPVAPKPVITRGVVDGPAYSPEEKADLVADFHRRLASIAGYCQRNGIVPVFVIPATNDRDFDPSRSILRPETTREQIAAFEARFLEARGLVATDPPKATERLRALIDEQPSYAEAHFWYARLLEGQGDWAGARRHYLQARELDGMPIRCPEAFREQYRAVAREFPGVVLVDGDAVLTPLTSHGILSDHQFHDAHHPTLLSYIALSQSALDQMAGRRVLSWPEGTASPRIDPFACADRFGMDRARWTTVLDRCRSFYERTAFMKFDPAERLRKEEVYAEGKRKVAGGAAPEATGLPGVGRRPTESPGQGSAESAAPARSRSM